MVIRTDRIIKQADNIVAKSHSRDPFTIANFLDIYIMERDFIKQLGAYEQILSYGFIFLKKDLDPDLQRTVLLHEIGHHVLHKDILTEGEIISDLGFFTSNSRMEYEANMFAAQILIPDDEFIELGQQGYTNKQMASAFGINENLIALKVDLLNKQGYQIKKLDYASDFLII